MGKFTKVVNVTAVQINGHIYSSPTKAANIIMNQMRKRMYDRQEKRTGDLWSDMAWRRNLMGLEARCYRRILAVMVARFR